VNDQVEPEEEHALEATARQLLVEWANAQDHWVRQLVAEVLSSGARPSADAIDAIFAAFLAEKDLSDETAAVVPPLMLEEAAEAAAEALLITRLSEVTGVNALASGQVIEFNPGLTVLFGENATGKTGYARVLKQLAAVRRVEPILPNVHDPAAPTAQSARIDYRVGQLERTLPWTGETGVPPFTHVAIFDSPCVLLHVDEDLSYVFTPNDLALFRHVTAGLGDVRSRLSEAVAARRPAANAFLPRFTRGTSVFVLVETLGAASDLDKIRELARVSEHETASLADLETRVTALQTDADASRLAVARGRRDLHERLMEFANIVASFDAEAYNEAVETAAAAEAEYANLRRELFGQDQEDGAAKWQDFVLGGEAYREHLEQHDYPQAGDSCLYCQQPLSDEAMALLRRYREFANAESRKRSDDARGLARTVARHLTGCDAPGLSEAVAAQQQNDADDPALSAAVELLDAVTPQQAATTEIKPVDWGSLNTTAVELREASTARKDAAAALVADLTTKSGERAEALATATSERNEMKDRLELKRLLPNIETYISDARWAARASQLERNFTSLLRSLTEVAKTASEQLLNADFQQRFTEECARLRAPAVALDFPGRQGQAARRKTVAATRPSSVLSEGEQKVIALADFIAEASLRLTPSPVVFDDPVNSLDYRRVSEVASRIAALAAHRQVIVFSHNIWFVTELLGHFESNRDRCSYYDVNDDPEKGMVVPGSHPRVDTVNNIKSKINQLIQSADTTEGETREALIQSAYSWIRSWSEVVSETELLGGVTQRYQAHVMMTALPNIKVEHLPAAIGVILPIFQRACRVTEGHSQPLETLAVRPSLADLKQDWEKLQAARKAYQDA
jgi:hypothetical protein